ncbi:MAG: hypothetical protein PHQ91_14515, partial [Thermoanaerobaculaceae bacterium]|nr:hypothetical protein [Thermoanaerobaculaceae bacterium]
TGVLAAAAAGNAEVNLERCLVANNGVGVQANAGQTVRLSDTMVTGNATGLQGPGTVASFGNNQVAGNASNGVTPTSVAQQ